MKLFLLRPKEDLPADDNPWDPWYDKAFGFVVRAENETKARALANSEGGDETGKRNIIIYRTGGDPWLDPKYSSCKELSQEGDEEIIMRDYAKA